MTRFNSLRPAAVEIICPPRADALLLGATIASAFHSLPASQYLIPDPDRRRVLYPDYFKLAVEDALDHGTVYAVSGGQGVALWLPVPASGLTAAESDGRIKDPDLAARDHLFHQCLHASHPVGRGAHHWLMILAVRPDRQSKGLGTALLDAHHAYLDQQGIGAYLEAANQRAREFYRTRHGYNDADEPIQLPNRALMYPMWREPQAAL